MMETVIVIAQHRNQCYEKNINQGSPRSSDFREINFRSFQSGAGILPTPIKGCTTPETKLGFGFSPVSPFPRTPLPAYFESLSEENTTRNWKRTTLKKSSSTPIRINYNVGSDSERCLLSDEFPNSELWAGPAYSNSPPPSSLPIPKFSVPPKRTVSLDLPSSLSLSDVNLHPIARSAPPSPKRDHNSSGRNLFHSADYATATKDLRRILNLDMIDD